MHIHKIRSFSQCLIRKVYYTVSVISMMFLIIFSSTAELSEKHLRNLIWSICEKNGHIDIFWLSYKIFIKKSAAVSAADVYGISEH